MSDSDDDLEESSEGGDLMETEDSMTLVQYQNSHRKETLARKSIQIQMNSHKKERVVTGGEEH